MKFFKGIGDVLRVGRNGIFRSAGVLVKPFKGLIARVMSDKVKKEIENEAKAYVLGYLANEYEDKFFAEAIKYSKTLFDVVEKVVNSLPKMFGKEVINKINRVEVIVLKYLDKLDARVDDMKADGKITNTECDQLVFLITQDFFEEVMVVFNEVKEMFVLEDVKEEAEPVVIMSEKKEAPKLFSESSRDYLKGLEEKYKID